MAGSLRIRTRTIFQEEELALLKIEFVFCEEQFEKNRSRITVFSDISVEDESVQQRQNTVFYILEQLCICWNRLIHTVRWLLKWLLSGMYCRVFNQSALLGQFEMHLDYWTYYRVFSRRLVTSDASSKLFVIKRGKLDHYFSNYELILRLVYLPCKYKILMWNQRFEFTQGVRL